MQADERVKRVGRGLLWLSVAALVLGALPLYAISLYNHPYYDDYGFSAKAHQAWRDTGSVGAVLRAAWESAARTRPGLAGHLYGHAAGAMCSPAFFPRSCISSARLCCSRHLSRAFCTSFRW